LINILHFFSVYKEVSMSLNFPDSPVANVTTYTAGTTTWLWNGIVWNNISDPGFATETYVDTAVSSVTATSIGLGNVTNESKATLFTSPTFTGTTTLQQSTELLNTKTSATGTVTHDFSTGAIWYHSSISANFTANFTNVPITADRAISVVLILVQGATPYIPNAVQIDGAVQTINWSGATAPTGNASQIDTVSFTFIRISDSWTVIGSLTSYG